LSVLPKALRNLIDEFGLLPGVGPRTAERYAYSLIKADSAKDSRLAAAMCNVQRQVDYCQKTFVFVEAGQEVSPLYSDPDRDKTTVAVVEDPLDIVPIENTRRFQGTYHVLGGLISPIDGLGPDQLRINELLQRIKKDKVSEIILAIPGSVEGETTALYLQKHIPDNITITRLARGLPAGVDLEYADQTTLLQALEGRQNL